MYMLNALFMECYKADKYTTAMKNTKNFNFKHLIKLTMGNNKKDLQKKQPYTNNKPSIL